MSEPAPVQTISVGGRYDVHVGPGVLSRLTAWVPDGRRVMVIHQPGSNDNGNDNSNDNGSGSVGRVGLLHQVLDQVRAAGGVPFSHEVPDAEAAKDVPGAVDAGDVADHDHAPHGQDRDATRGTEGDDRVR